MKLRKLRLRGAIGLEDYGPEINIDFTQFSPGMIAFVGPNGAGKTTILENLHPWPQLMSRKGSLTKAFYLKDSFRSLDFEYQGFTYQSLIKIDGQAGKIEAFLYRDQKPLNNGGKDEYLHLVNELFGDYDTFTRSVFASQNGERITELTPTKVKEFFFELLGHQRYERLAEYCKAQIRGSDKEGFESKGLESVLSDIESRENLINEAVTKSQAEIDKKETEQAEVTRLEVEISEIEKEINALRDKIRQSEIASENVRHLRDLIKAIDTDIEALESEKQDIETQRQKALESIEKEIEKAESEIASLKELLEKAPDIREKIKRLDELKAQAAILSSKKAEVDILEAEKVSIENSRAKALEALKKESAALELEINSYKGLLNAATSIRDKAKRFEDLKNQSAALLDKKKELLELGEKKTEISQRISAAKSNRQDEIVRLKSERDLIASTIKSEKDALASDLKSLKNSRDTKSSIAAGLGDVPCKDTPEFVSVCPLLETARGAKDELSGIEAKIKDLSEAQGKRLPEEDDLDELDDKIANLENNTESHPEEAELAEIESKIGVISYDKKAHAEMDAEIKRLSQTNWQQQLSDLNKAEANLNAKTEQLESLKSREDQIGKEHDDRLASVDDKITGIAYDKESHADINAELGELNLTNWSEKLSELDKADANLESQKRQLEAFRERENHVSFDYDERTGVIDQKIFNKRSEKDSLNEEIAAISIEDAAVLAESKKLAESRLSASRDVLTQHLGKLSEIARLEKEIDDQQVQLESLSTQKKAVLADISDWKLLETALGKNGIPAMKLRNASPQISAIATDILQQFGSEWVLTLTTDKPSADGKKILDTFEIQVSTEKGIKPFGVLSGGQRVWVEEALRKAVTIYLVQNSGRDYRTIYHDEADGPLDPEKARAFLDTTMKAHELTGANHSIIITQRPDLWQSIPQRIHLNISEGKIEIVEGDFVAALAA